MYYIYDLIDNDGFQVGFHTTKEPINLRKKYYFYYHDNADGTPKKVFTGRFKKADLAKGRYQLIQKSTNLFLALKLEH